MNLKIKSISSFKDHSITFDYIEQLIQSGDYQKAALYSMALFNIPKAIEIYLQSNQYLCALCVAQLRLSFLNKSLFEQVLQKYANYLAQNGDYETSVLCYIRLRDLKQASKVLTRRIIQNEEQRELVDKLLKLLSQYDSTIQINI
jgi:tetratricopeptide (TPR) repeat protein